MSPSQSERRAATRAALVAAGRELFTADGYDASSAEAVVARAGVTRGALYHHFPDGKRDLFRAVLEEVETELIAALGARLSGGGEPMDLLVGAVDAYLERCQDADFARLTLQDAPAVLGWTEWRELDLHYGLGLTVGALQAAMDAGAIRPQPVVPLGHLLVAALGEAGLLIAAGEDRDAVRAPLVSLLDGLRV